jgi:RimJ/RimL family protein N-acetyltransferase
MDATSLFNLSIHTPRLFLHVPNGEEIRLLAQITMDGIQDPEKPHYQIENWYTGTLQDKEKYLRDLVHHHMHDWNKNDWQLPLAVVFENHPIGLVTLYAKDFPIARGFGCGYWLGKVYHNQGLGTEMLQAGLTLAFESLQAREAYLGAWSDNAVSLHIMEKLGFIFNGEYWMVRQGKAVKDKRMRLPKENWKRPEGITIQFPEECWSLFEV